MPTCALCGQEVESFEANMEQWVLSFIKQQQPDWGAGDGACLRCVSHYENLGAVISLVQSHDLD